MPKKEEKVVEVTISGETGEVEIDVLCGHDKDCISETKWINEALGETKKVKKKNYRKRNKTQQRLKRRK